VKGAETLPNGNRIRSGSLKSRAIGLLPSEINRRVRAIAWVSFAAQVALIATGGAVRLTASGLGCPEWPLCTEDSLTNTPEMGIHGVIEFANRLLTFVLAAVTILAFLSVFRFRKQRRDLFWITLLQGLSIPFQAVLGGITVLTGLNPFVVGAHFAVSIVLVSLTTMLVWRVYKGPRGSGFIAPQWYVAVAWATAAAVAVTVFFGILTTGSGPHAGDNSNPLKLAPRTGFDPEFMQHLHSWPAYVTLALTVVLIVGAIALSLPRRWVFALLAVEAVQTIVGITQARLGLPELLVGIHMVLAAFLVASMTTVLLSLRNRQAPQLENTATDQASSRA
jgi:cytochrome c oxidase assembly protein subunit 15